MPLRACLALAVATFVAACSSAPTPESAASSAGAVASFPGCSDVFNTNPSPTGAYYATDFGCSSDPYFTDPGDTCGSASCIQSAYDQGVCSTGQSNADCQRAVNWYSVGGASYGCGARLQVTNPSNGKSVIVMVLDNGPSCSVENDASFWVLDVSYPTIMYLFGEEEGWGDHARVDVVVVDPSTPLGPVSAAAPPPPPPPPPADDASSPGPDAGTPTDEGGVTVSCSTDGDCNPGSDGSGQICVGGQCVAGCNADWECPGSETCVSGQCQSGPGASPSVPVHALDGVGVPLGDDAPLELHRRRQLAGGRRPLHGEDSPPADLLHAREVLVQLVHGALAVRSGSL